VGLSNLRRILKVSKVMLHEGKDTGTKIKSLLRVNSDKSFEI